MNTLIFYTLSDLRGKKPLHIFLYLAIAGLIFTGCSKKDKDSSAETSGDYYFKATLDGSKKDFHTVKFQGSGNDGRWEHVVVGGYESSLVSSNGSVSPSLDFEIWRTGGNISAGTYSTPAEPIMISRYAIQKAGGTLLYNTINGKDIFTVKIAAISKEGIKGTFSGTLRNSAGTAMSVTDGSFNLPYDQLVNP